METLTLMFQLSDFEECFYALMGITIFFILPVTLYRLIRQKIEIAKTGMPFRSWKYRRGYLTLAFAAPLMHNLRFGVIVNGLMGFGLACLWLWFYDLLKKALIKKSRSSKKL